MEQGRSIGAFFIGVVVGVGVAIGVNQSGHGGDLLSPIEYVAPKGVALGAVAGIVAYGLARLCFRSSAAMSAWYLTVGILAATVGLVTLLWNFAWGVPLTSLEGAWLWPLALGSLLVAFYSVGRFRRVRKAARA